MVLRFYKLLVHLISVLMVMVWVFIRIAYIAVVMEVPAAILIVLGFFTRPLAVIFVFYTLGTAVIGHHFWNMTGDAVMPNMINFYKNISIAGGFLLLAIVGPGKISLDRR